MSQGAEVNLESRSVSPWGAVIKVLVTPTDTFQSLGQKPPWAPAYIVESAVGLLTLVQVLRLLPDFFASRGMSQTQDSAMVFTLAFGGLLSIGGPWLVGAFIAWIATHVGNYLGKSFGFAAYFAIIGYSRIPVYLGVLVSLVGTWVGATIPQSLSFLVPKGSSVYVWAFVDSLKPFQIWYLILLAIGFATVQKTSIRRAALLPMAPYLLSLALEMYKVSTRGVPGW